MTSRTALPKECTVCRKPLKSRSSRHYHGHCQAPERKPFKCDQCERTFSSRSHKTFHEETHLSRRLPCRRCDRAYQHQRDLDLHLREHEAASEVVAYKCNRCTEQFESQQALMKHRKSHSESKRFECEQCDMKFTLKGNLTKHIKILHSKQKLFKCGQCDKAFYRNNALKFHMLSHQTRNFQCKSCDKEFVDARNLERHLKTHVTLKEFRCDLCGISSSRRDNILRHARSFHPESNPIKVVLRGELGGEQLDAIRQDVQQSKKTLEKKAETKPPEPTSNRISVIKVVGTPKPLETPKPPASESAPPNPEPPPSKPPTKLDRFEIYRKILRPSHDDDDDIVPSCPKPSTPSTTAEPNDAPTPSVVVKPTNINNGSGINYSSINNFSEVHWRKRTSQIFTNSTR